MRLHQTGRTARPRFRARAATAMLAASGLFGMSSGIHAAEIDLGESDVKLRWDNTVKYSAAWRVNKLDGRVAGTANNPNLDDGDRNFGKGLISNRLDLLSELDASYKAFGVRVSGAAWYDDVYNRGNDNNGAGAINSSSVPAGEFTRATSRLHGQKAEFLDAFTYGRVDLAPESSVSYRLGRHTLLYGETLFFGGNGIANAQTPIDVIKAVSVPNSQFKEFMMPVNQLSASFQVNPALSIGGYYQLEWRKYRLPASGSYFSFADFLDAGGEQLILGPGAVATRSKDLSARDSGQGGLQMKYKSGDVEYGLYAARYHDKVPLVQLNVDSMTYKLVYPQDIKTYGASVSTVVGETNVALEVSVRRDTPLSPSAGLIVTADPSSDGRHNPAYPLGNSFHANLSWISVFNANSLWQGAELLGELGYNRVTGVTRNREALDPNTTRDAAAIRFLFSPQYFQVYPGVDLTVPIGVGYGLIGRSAVSNFGGLPEHGGDASIGLSADIKKQWKAALNYTRYYGPTGSVLRPDSSALSFDQVMKDRSFISFALQTAF